MNWRATLERLRAAVWPDAEAGAILDAAQHVSEGMSRRTFLRAGLIATAVAATVDVEQLLWTPGEKTIFIPDAIDLTGNTLVTFDWLTRESLRLLERNLQVVARFNRPYESRSEHASAHRSGPPPAHFSVDLRTDALKGLTRAQARTQFAEPIAESFAESIAASGVRRFSDLELPKGMEQALQVRSPSGLSLRGIRGVELDPDSGTVVMRTRFDIAGMP